METADRVETEDEETTEFLTASELVSLRKPDEDPARCVVGEKYYFCSNSWMEKKAVECALESFKDSLDHKRATRKCDLMHAEWDQELKASITSKLKGKFVQHMGRACNGKIALSPEESIFLLENGTIEIVNDETLLSTEEAYKIMLTENLSVERYQVYSLLSQLGFIVVAHQTELGVTTYEKRINLDQHPIRNKRKIVPDLSGEPEAKRLTFSGAFNKLELPVDCSNQVTPTEADPVVEPDMNGHPDKSLAHDEEDNDIRDLDGASISVNENKESVEDTSESAANSATLGDEIEALKETPACVVNTTGPNHDSNGETLPADDDTLNGTNPPVSCSKSSETSKGLEVELETVEVGDIFREMPVLHDARSHFDINSNPPPSDYQLGSTSCLSKNSMDVMNIDSENTEISSASDVSRNNNVSNINVTLEDSSCSVMDAVGLPNNQGSNSEVMSCSSENDDVLSVGVPSECDLSENFQEDDEIELIEVTKKETKPLAVIDLLSDDDQSSSEFSSSDDEIRVLKVCNGIPSNIKSHAVGSLLMKKCKKEEKCSPVPVRRHVPLLSFPACARKEVICVARPPIRFLPPNVCPPKEAYVLNFKMKSNPPPNRLWNSFRDMREYQRNRRLNGNADHLGPSFQNRDAIRRSAPVREERQNFNVRRTGTNDNDESRWADGSSHIDSRHSVHSNHITTSRMNHYSDSSSYGGVKQNLNHMNTNAPEAFTSYQNLKQNSWMDRNNGEPLREGGPNFTPSRSSNSSETFPNTPSFNTPGSFNPFGASRDIHLNQFQYPVQNTSAAINSVVSVSNQDMNVSMVGNHILHPPLHSSSPHLPSFNANLPNLAAIGPLDIMAEVQRTAYTVATNMLSSMFGQNMNPHGMPQLPPFNAFQPVQNNPFGFPPQSNSAFNAQNFNSERYSMHNRHAVREPPRRQQPHSVPFPCYYRNLRNRSSWNEVREAIGDDHSVDVGSDVEEVPMSPTDILWDPKNISPLVKPGTKYPPSEVFKKLQITRAANLLDNSFVNKTGVSTTCSLEISFDVYLPGYNYKKTCPGIPKHRLIVVRSTDPIPKYSDLVVLQKKWSDGATLQVAVVDHGDISFHSFNSIHLPILIPHEK